MDPNTVRLILLVVGAVLILALYLWERSRDTPDGQDSEDYDADDAPYGASPSKRDPRLGEVDEDDLDVRTSPTSHRRDELDPHDEAVETSPATPVSDDAPLLIQLSVAKRKGEFEGPALLEVAESCGLRPGDMDIFHCLDDFDDGTRIYFSMANMVKPGTFPFDDMEDFSTPGMMLFAQLEGYPEDLTILEEMIATARKLANTLGGDVLDETRRPLTVRKEEDLRSAVLANEARQSRVRRR
jgi:cell division protein ZipA